MLRDLPFNGTRQLELVTDCRGAPLRHVVETIHFRACLGAQFRLRGLLWQLFWSPLDAFSPGLLADCVFCIVFACFWPSQEVRV